MIHPKIAALYQRMPFNAWSKERIEDGHKRCTSRYKKYHPDFFRIERRTLQDVRDNLWRDEGAESPEEFEQIWIDLYPQRGFVKTDLVWVHWFDNPYWKGDES